MVASIKESLNHLSIGQVLNLVNYLTRQKELTTKKTRSDLVVEEYFEGLTTQVRNLYPQTLTMTEIHNRFEVLSGNGDDRMEGEIQNQISKLMNSRNHEERKRSDHCQKLQYETYRMEL